MLLKPAELDMFDETPGTFKFKTQRALASTKSFYLSKAALEAEYGLETLPEGTKAIVTVEIVLP